MVSLYLIWYAAMLTSYGYNDLSAGMIAVPIWTPRTAMLLALIVFFRAIVTVLPSMMEG